MAKFAEKKFTSICSIIYFKLCWKMYENIRKNIGFGMPKTIVCIKVGEKVNESMSWAESVFSKWENPPGHCCHMKISFTSMWFYLRFSLDFCMCGFLCKMNNILTSIPWLLPTYFSFVTGHEFQWIVCFIAYSRPSHFIFFKIEYLSLFRNKIISGMLTCADCSKNKHFKYEIQEISAKLHRIHTLNTEFWLNFEHQNVTQIIIMWHM